MLSALLRCLPRPSALLALVAAASVLAVAAPAQADWLSDLEAPFLAALESGSLALGLALVFAAGLATSLTPCVYPMIAITVSVFGARQASRRTAMWLSTAFVLGIATFFTPLGVIAGTSGGLFGAYLANPWVVSALALLFVALALSMFGAYELNLPPALQNRLAKVGGVGAKGAFALGLVSGLIAAPCTGPVLGGLLFWIGRTGNAFTGGLYLFAYALGLGVLFWLVGVFALSLPKSGRWLEWVKSVFGAIMLIVALYFVRDFLPGERPAERSAPWIWSGVALLLTGIALGAIHLSYHGTSRLVRARKTLGLGFVVIGATAMIWYATALPPGAKIEWLDDYGAARALAQRDQRPLLVDFGASWCAACGELDRETLSDPRVVALARERNVVPVRIDLSPGQDTPEKRAVLAGYEQRGLPLVVLHDRSGQEVGRITSFVEPDQFLQFLDRVD